MSLNDVLLFATEILFVLLTLIAIVDYLGHRNPRRRDFAWMAASLGLPLGVTLLNDLFGIKHGALDLLGAFALFSQPYFLFRLLQYHRPSPVWLHLAVLLGMVGTWVILVLYIARYPAITQSLIFGYSVVVNAYCTWRYAGSLRQTVGILRRRLVLIVVSSGLFTLAVLGNVLNPWLPAAVNVGGFGLTVAMISAILYYVAFIPPRWLRNAWLFEELRDFTQPDGATRGRSFSMAESFQQLCSAGSQAVNGLLGMVVSWDADVAQWKILGSTGASQAAQVIPNGAAFLEQVWQQRRPLAIYTRTLADQEARRRMEVVGRTWLLVPILTAEHIWGVLVVVQRDRALFIDDDLNLLDLFARQCAIILENRRLIDELQGYSAQLERNVEARTAELRESEGRFRHLADSAPVMIWMTDAQGLPIYFNQQWYDFTGFSPEDGIDPDWAAAVVHPEDAQATRTTYLQHQQQHLPFRHEYRMRRYDGVYHWLFLSAVPRTDEQGEFIGYIGSTLDITERKEAEERLLVIYRISEAVNRAGAVEQIYELALAGLERVLHVSRAAILLLDAEGAMRMQAGRGLSEAYRAATDGQLPHVVNPHDPQPVLIPDVAAAELGEQQQVTWDEGIRAIGYIPLVEQQRLIGKFMIYYDQPHVFTETEVQWAQTIARHVAFALQRKLTEAKLRTYTHTLEELNQLSFAATFSLQRLLQMITDVSTELSGAQFGAFVYTNHAHNGDLPRQQPYLFATATPLPHDTLAHFLEVQRTTGLAAAFMEGTTVRMSDRLQSHRKDSPPGQDGPGLELCSLLAVPVISRADEVIGVLVFGHSKPDVFTDQAEQLVGSLAGQLAITLENAWLYVQVKESETALRELNATLEERVEKRTSELRHSNEELDRFAYVASHDLKAPLRAINHLANWIEQDAADHLPPQSREHITKLQGRVQRMETLLDDLLAYSRVGRLHHRVERVDVAELIHTVTDTLAPPPGFTVKIDGDLPVMEVERTPLETVFRNLIGNAIKHHHQPDAGVVVISAKPQDGFVEFRVVDDGPGIAPEFHERIFEIFQTLRPRDQVESSGVGLAIVKKSVEGLGGNIRVLSAQGQGTTFCFTWPAQMTPAAETVWR